MYGALKWPEIYSSGGYFEKYAPSVRGESQIGPTESDLPPQVRFEGGRGAMTYATP